MRGAFIEVAPDLPMAAVRRRARAAHVQVASVTRHGVVDGIIFLD
jgi:hypothetical protein